MKKVILVILYVISNCVSIHAMEENNGAFNQDHTASWENLPPEIKMHIFSSLPGDGKKIKDLLAHRLINKECAALIDTCPLALAKRYLAAARHEMLCPNILLTYENRFKDIEYHCIYGLFFSAVEAADLNVVNALLYSGIIDTSSLDFQNALANHPSCLRDALNADQAGTTDKDRIEIAKILINNGVDVNYQAEYMFYDISKNTALIIATKKGYDEIVELLIAKGAVIEAKNRFGEMPIFIAVQLGLVNIARLFLKRGVSVTASNDFGYTPLIQAAAYGQTAIIELLISFGADVNAQGKSGQTALRNAVHCGRLNTTEQLLGYGADVNYQNRWDNHFTPLMHAVKGNSRQLVELLLEYGADPDMKNRCGQTARELAKCKSIVELLNSYIKAKKE